MSGYLEVKAARLVLAGRSLTHEAKAGRNDVDYYSDI